MALFRSEFKNPVVALVVGVLAFMGATFWLGSTVSFAVRAVAVDGVVSDTYRCPTGRRRSTCGDVNFTYQDGSYGRLTEVRSPGHQGERVKVLYRPRHPEDARLGGFNLWFLPLVFEGIAVVLLVGGVRKWLESGGV